MYTLKQYIDGEISHHDYYICLADNCHLPSIKHLIPDVIAALNKDDEYLNTIPLGKWFDLARHISMYENVRQATGQRLTLGVGVCMLKEKAKQLAKNN